MTNSLRTVTVRLVTAIIVTAALFLPALPATATDGVTIVQPDDKVVLSADNCRDLGSDQFGNTGWSCVAFAYSGHTDGRFYDAWGHNKVYCTNAYSRLVQCAGIHETVGVYGIGGRVPAPSSGVCGARFGHTPCSPGIVANASAHVQSPVVPNEYWAASTNLSIVLPQSGKTISGPNVATSHYRLATQNSR